MRNDMKRASFPQQLSTLTQGNEALIVALKELLNTTYIDSDGCSAWGSSRMAPCVAQSAVPSRSSRLAR